MCYVYMLQANVYNRLDKTHTHTLPHIHMREWFAYTHMGWCAPLVFFFCGKREVNIFGYIASASWAMSFIAHDRFPASPPHPHTTLPTIASCGNTAATYLLVPATCFCCSLVVGRSYAFLYGCTCVCVYGSVCCMRHCFTANY